MLMCWPGCCLTLPLNADIPLDHFFFQDEVVAVAGRIVSKREQGKLLFYTIKADGANVQVMASLADYEGGEEAFWKVRQAGKSRMDTPTRRRGKRGLL